MADVLEEAELGTVLLIVLAVGAIGYLVYQWISNNSGDNELPGQGGGGALGNLLNNTLEIGQSSESYTSALQQAVTSPITTIESILGLNQTSMGDTDDSSTSGGF